MRLLAYEGWGGPDPWDLPESAEPVGYAWMVRSRSLDVMPHHRWSFVARVGARSTFIEQNIVWEVFPAFRCMSRFWKFSGPSCNSWV